MTRLKVFGNRCTGRNDCENPATDEPHGCPYQEDVNGNDEEICTCCEDCEHECAMDI